MDRVERLLSMFDASGFGLEVGPSYNPLLPKSKYRVETIDHADAETLRKKYHDNASQIEEVDYVSDGGGMLDTIGEASRYDFIVASHVIEHMTDIVRFLQDCEELLKPGGRLVLAVPDKRYCFDTLRPLSTVGQALQAHFERWTRHPPSIHYDNEAYAVHTKSGGIVWIEPDLEDIQLMRQPEAGKRVLDTLSGDYRDAHGWVFTPASFRYLIKTLQGLGYINLGEVAFYKHPRFQPGMHEFYVCLSKGAPPITDDDLELLKTVQEEIAEITPGREPQPAPQPVPMSAEFEAATRRIHELEVAHAAMLNSTSWRITAPLRALKNMLVRLRLPQTP